MLSVSISFILLVSSGRLPSLMTAEEGRQEQTASVKTRPVLGRITHILQGSPLLRPYVCAETTATWAGGETERYREAYGNWGPQQHVLAPVCTPNVFKSQLILVPEQEAFHTIVMFCSTCD